MAADPVMRKACENAKNSLFFDLAGDNVKWKTVSLLHVEYPEGIVNVIFLHFAKSAVKIVTGLLGKSSFQFSLKGFVSNIFI